MPSPIHPADQLAALIRTQVSSLRQRTAPHQPATRPGASAGRMVSADLAGLAAQRVRLIEPDDPQRERKAVHIYLETVLLAQLGPAMVNDPSFHMMVDQVQQQMEADPALALAMGEAARALLHSGG